MGYIQGMNSDVFTALAEPNRLRIVEYLRQGPRPVGEIAEALSLRQPQVSKHLQVLSAAGLVQAQAMAQRRIYALQASRFRQLESWLDGFARVWEGRLDALEQHLFEVQTQPKRRRMTRRDSKH